MRVLKFVLALLLALAVHGVGTWLLPELPRVLDLFLVVTVLNALGGSSARRPARAAPPPGSPTTRSPAASTGSTASLIPSSGTRSPARRSGSTSTGPGAVFVTVALATLLEETVFVLVALLFTAPEPPEPIWVVVQALANGAAGTILYLVAGRARSLREHAERRRMSRIRL